MLFTSLLFIVFFLIVYILYWSFSGQRIKEIILLLASIIFYGSWSIPFLGHFLIVILINYVFMLGILKYRSKYLMFSIGILNVLNLAVFKYYYFFSNTIYELTGYSFTSILDERSIKIVLPLAISFYTFQILAYTIDVYRREVREKISLLDYTIFIMFFPQLIAGPIMRFHDFIPQLKKIRFYPEYIYPGMGFIVLGIVKKVLIADNIATIADPIWTNYEKYDWTTLLLAVHSFSWQIYCDFSGYSDIAIGTALLLGFTIPQNFYSPLLASSPKEIWNRWHVTLSTWLRDYLYIALGGNRKGEFRSYINLILTFTLGGLWHGANWTFILWGFSHGVILSIHRILDRAKINLIPSNKFGKIIGILITYHFFIFTAFIFRANSITDFYKMLLSIFKLQSGTILNTQETLFYLCFFAFIIQVFHYFEIGLNLFHRFKEIIIFLSFLVVLILLGLYSSSGKEFIYFQF